MTKKIQTYGQNIVGPVMYSYVEWVLDEAQKRKLKKLYFLARDGFLLYEIAKRIVEKRKIDIECKYLYCSRQSLRMPTYHFIGDEAFELLFLGGYYVTKESIVKRAMLSNDEINELFEILSVEDSKKILKPSEFNDFCDSLKSCEYFRKKVFEKSEKAYALTIDYLKQESLFDDASFGIVDSGWTGSMQRSLRQLLEKSGFSGKITGFYFGMYVDSKDEKDGDYLTFYFSKNSGTLRKASFNNNVFECMLSANHPMTVGYEKTEDACVTPIFAKPQSSLQLELIEAQIKGALTYTDEALAKQNQEFVYKKSLKKVHKILKACLMKPSKEFAETYGRFTFCDDVTEDYYFSLANEEMKKSIGNYMFITRVFRKIFKIKKSDQAELFWPYGVVAFCHPLIRPWYRLNIRCWEILKAIMHK